LQAEFRYGNNHVQREEIRLFWEKGISLEKPVAESMKLR
jgi:hypothetical protein